MFYKLPLYLKRLVKVCYKFDPIYRFLNFFCESFSRFSKKKKLCDILSQLSNARVKENGNLS